MKKTNVMIGYRAMEHFPDSSGYYLTDWGRLYYENGVYYSSTKKDKVCYPELLLKNSKGYYFSEEEMKEYKSKIVKDVCKVIKNTII